MEAQVSDLIGKTIIEIEKSEQEIIFKCKDGSIFKMHHIQDCCESVHVEDIIGDIDDLIGSQILTAREDTSDKNPSGIDKGFQESFTWTFYNIATIKGFVTIRWYGKSNGSYSERVDFVKIK